MPKICIADGCTLNVWGKGYCLRHQYLRTDKKRQTESKKNILPLNLTRQNIQQKPIKPYSVKRQKLNKVYSTLRDVFLNTRKVCEIQSPECTHAATCVHHTKGRGEFLLTVQFWKASCIACNGYVEENDKWARDNGHKLSKFNNKNHN